jgi:hypothetical protein
LGRQSDCATSKLALQASIDVFPREGKEPER